MKVGINQWSFHGQPFERMLAVAAKAGFETFEPAVNETAEGAALSAGLHLGSTAADGAAVAALARDLGLAIPTLACGLGWKYPMTSADSTTRSKAREANVRVLELAAALGSDTVLVVPGVVNAEISYDAAWGRAQEELAHLADRAAALKVKLGVENVWNKFILSPLEMARFVDEIGSPWVQVYFDVGNVLVYGFPEQWIRILGRRIAAVHVKDFKTAIGNITGFTNLLSGDVNWPAVTAALRDVGYQGPLTAELAPYKHAPEEHARDTARHIRAIIKGV